MFTIFKEEKVITAGILVFFMSQRSGASDAGVDVSYNDPETDNMATTGTGF